MDILCTCWDIILIMIYRWRTEAVWCTDGEDHNFSRKEMSRVGIKKPERCAFYVIGTLRLVSCSSFITAMTKREPMYRSTQSLSVKHCSWDGHYFLLIKYLCVCFQNTRYLVVHSDRPGISRYCCTTFRVHLKNTISRGAPSTMSTCREGNIIPRKKKKRLKTESTYARLYQPRKVL